MAGGGGYDIGASLSFATSSGASNNSPFSLVDNSGSPLSGKTIALYLIIAVVGLIGLWILVGKK